MFEFDLLVSVVDKVTGYDGIITARAEYCNNAVNQYLVENIDSTGRPVEVWMAEDRLVLSDDFMG